jgi:5-oxoprolinase (ATP-hydrolysing) subunit A
MRTIDLNVDLGEGGFQDAALIALASSANIACGGHAGDESTMRSAIASCLANGVAIGAHPGYEDPEHFGRRALGLQPLAIAELVSRQIGRLGEFADQAGGRIHHIKPHGALYNQADQDPEIASAVAETVKRILPACGFYVPPAGALAVAGKAAGLRVIAEGFVDRRYQEDGSLVCRDQAGAVIEDLEAAVAQALQIACEERVVSASGAMIPLVVRTLCVHGDGAQAVLLLRAVRAVLENAGFAIVAEGLS